MQAARIAELLEPFLGSANDQRLTTNDALRISMYIDILLHWNARINLTAIHDPEEIVTRHFGESLFAARHLFPSRVGADAPCPESSPSVRPAERSEAFDTAPAEHRRTAALQHRVEGPERIGASAPARVADLGSGAGFPGIPIKLWAPHLSLTLIESNHKKATFLREVVRNLTLTDINIRTARAESLEGDSFAVVALRAVERFAKILPTAASLVAPRGRLAVLIGAAQHSQSTSTLSDFDFSPPLPIPLSASRILLSGRKRDKH